MNLLQLAIFEFSVNTIRNKGKYFCPTYSYSFPLLKESLELVETGIGVIIINFISVFEVVIRLFVMLGARLSPP